MPRSIQVALIVLALAPTAFSQLYPVGSANIPVPISNGGVTVSAVTIYTHYPPSPACSTWQLAVLAVTVTHPVGMQFTIAPPCTIHGSTTWFDFDSGASTFRLEIYGTGPTLPGVMTSVLQVPVAGTQCNVVLQPAYYAWALRIQYGPWTSIGSFMVGAHHITGGTLSVSPTGDPHVGALYAMPLLLYSGGVGNAAQGQPVLYALGFALSQGSFSDQFNQWFVPLAVDDLLVMSLTENVSCTPPFCPPGAVFINNIGTINPAVLPQMATAYLQVPAVPALVGLTIYGAVAVLDPWGNLSGVSPPVTLTIQP